MKKLLLVISIFIFINLANDLLAKNYAIIITGDTPYLESNSPTFNWKNKDDWRDIYKAFWHDTFLMWETLYNLGFENDNIYILYGEGVDYQSDYSKYSASKYGFNNGITDFPAYIQDVENIFTWLKDGNSSLGIPKLTENDFLFIFTFGHGDPWDVDDAILYLMDGFMTNI